MIRKDLLDSEREARQERVTIVTCAVGSELRIPALIHNIEQEYITNT